MPTLRHLRIEAKGFTVLLTLAMTSGRSRTGWLLMAALALSAAAQSSDPFVARGSISFDGRTLPYRIQHLPPASFPQLPLQTADELNRRGCLIPQTYQAHHPENVIHGSFQQPGSSDWAVLCEQHGEVTLLVFFGDNPAQAIPLASAPETQRLQPYPGSPTLGFNWGIDPVSPDQIHALQSGMWPRPRRLDHDALADSKVDFDEKTTYHYFSQDRWTTLKMPRD